MSSSRTPLSNVSQESLEKLASHVPVASRSGNTGNLRAIIRESERNQRSPRRDEHILPAVEHVRHRRGAPDAGTCLVVPEVFARICLERHEVAFVIPRENEPRHRAHDPGHGGRGIEPSVGLDGTSKDQRKRCWSIGQRARKVRGSLSRPQRKDLGGSIVW